MAECRQIKVLNSSGSAGNVLVRPLIHGVVFKLHERIIAKDFNTHNFRRQWNCIMYAYYGRRKIKKKTTTNERIQKSLSDRKHKYLRETQAANCCWTLPVGNHMASTIVYTGRAGPRVKKLRIILERTNTFIFRP